MLFVKWNFAEGHGWLEACFARMTHFVLNPQLWILGLDAESPNSGDQPSVLCALFLCHQVLPAVRWIRLAWTGNYGWASGIQLEVILVLFASCQTSSSNRHVFFPWLGVLPAARWIRLAWTGNYGWASGIQLEVILVLFASCQTSSSNPHVFFLWLCMLPGGTRVQPADWCGPAVVLPGVQDPVLMSALMQIHHHPHATFSASIRLTAGQDVPFSAWAASTGMSGIPFLDENWGKRRYEVLKRLKD